MIRLVLLWLCLIPCSSAQNLDDDLIWQRFCEDLSTFDTARALLIWTVDPERGLPYRVKSSLFVSDAQMASPTVFTSSCWTGINPSPPTPCSLRSSHPKRWDPVTSGTPNGTDSGRSANNDGLQRERAHHTTCGLVGNGVLKAGRWPSGSMSTRKEGRFE